VKRLRDGFERLPTRGTFTRAAKGLTADFYPMDFTEVEAIRRQGYFHETIGMIPKFSYQDFRSDEHELQQQQFKQQSLNMNASVVSSILGGGGESVKISTTGSVTLSPQKTGRRTVQGAHVSRMYKSPEGRIENTPEDNFSAYRKWHPDLIPTNNTNGMNNSILLSPSYDNANNSTIATLTTQMIQKQQNMQIRSDASIQQSIVEKQNQQQYHHQQGEQLQLSPPKGRERTGSHKNATNNLPFQPPQQQQQQQYPTQLSRSSQSPVTSDHIPSTQTSRRPSITSAITLDTMIDSQREPPQHSPPKESRNLIITPFPPSTSSGLPPNLPKASPSNATRKQFFPAPANNNNPNNNNSSNQLQAPPSPRTQQNQQQQQLQQYQQQQAPSLSVPPNSTNNPPTGMVQQQSPQPIRKKSVLGQIFGTTSDEDLNMNPIHGISLNQPFSNDINSNNNIPNPNPKSFTPPPKNINLTSTSSGGDSGVGSVGVGVAVGGRGGSGNKKQDYNVFFQDDQELINQTKYFIHQSNLDNKPLPHHVLHHPSSHLINTGDNISYVSSNASVGSNTYDGIVPLAISSQPNTYGSNKTNSPFVRLSRNENNNSGSGLSISPVPNHPGPHYHIDSYEQQNLQKKSGTSGGSDWLENKPLHHHHHHSHHHSHHGHGGGGSAHHMVMMGSRSMETMPTIEERSSVGGDSEGGKNSKEGGTGKGGGEQSSYHSGSNSNRRVSIGSHSQEDNQSATLSQLARPNELEKDEKLMSSYMKWLQEQQKGKDNNSNVGGGGSAEYHPQSKVDLSKCFLKSVYSLILFLFSF
jgi:hypothetical protein